ncbi:hypothetical protein PPERSA_01390 [Pseudocohnilembus persalinus]|uniref:Ubiquitin-like domain-containing protein n=1 Tax=Pseudocohnilembus persalinus TaxID=266149 RepID=A0A0V0QH05_PSEPJ|nr:hypothetical protein PPERSA_01390 [Pseudocohnilembus persalinus]|eukprot:KRX01487.1 hypothetical protein PPERSA_01390 [Pseudocohnilembus persalinus]
MNTQKSFKANQTSAQKNQQQQQNDDNNVPETIYIRVVREAQNTQTIFFTVRPNDSIDGIRKNLCTYFSLEPNDIRLYLGEMLLDPNSNIYDQNVQNNAKIIVKIRNKMGEFEA